MQKSSSQTTQAPSLPALALLQSTQGGAPVSSTRTVMISPYPNLPQDGTQTAVFLIAEWNSLLADVVMATTLGYFESRVKSYLQTPPPPLSLFSLHIANHIIVGSLIPFNPTINDTVFHSLIHINGFQPLSFSLCNTPLSPQNAAYSSTG